MHPIHLVAQMDDEASTIAALLHDVEEDTSYTIKELEQMDFPKELLDAIRLLTHDDDMDYVFEIKTNPIATKVKLADLAHNSYVSRLPGEPIEKYVERLEKYRKAKEILEGK